MLACAPPRASRRISTNFRIHKYSEARREPSLDIRARGFKKIIRRTREEDRATSGTGTKHQEFLLSLSLPLSVSLRLPEKSVARRKLHFVLIIIIIHEYITVRGSMDFLATTRIQHAGMHGFVIAALRADSRNEPPRRPPLTTIVLKR